MLSRRNNIRRNRSRQTRMLPVTGEKEVVTGSCVNCSPVDYATQLVVVSLHMRMFDMSILTLVSFNKIRIPIKQSCM